uniref:Uncharacterized protein n=1 Tax=Mesocestoides corti TaxID=53468 RepID=A0A5K3G1P5_MESCO
MIVNLFSAEGQRIFEQNLLKEERDFQKTIRTLPTRRRAFQDNVLKSRRSYRKRLNLGLILTSRRLRQQSIDFLRLVENNFDDLNQLSVNKILNLVELLKSLISFRLPKKGTETTKLVFADGDFLRRLEVYNQTLDIASILLDHMRRSFEVSIEGGRRPRTTQMMAGLLYLLRRLASVTCKF